MSPTPRHPVRALPSHFVSARHGRTVRGVAGELTWEPFGEQHARELGSPRTACGLTSLDWRIFWELPFPGDPGETCPRCMRAVAERDQQRRTARDLPVGA